MSNERSFCSVYRSPRKEEMYLYVERGQDLEQLPAELRKVFGPPEHALDLVLTATRKLARANAAEVLEKIREQGFYLQMPPKVDHRSEWPVNQDA